MQLKNLSKKIGIGNNKTLQPIEFAISLINSGVDRSSPSETKKVLPEASGWSIHRINKSTKLSILY